MQKIGTSTLNCISVFAEEQWLFYFEEFILHGALTSCPGDDVIQYV